MADFEKFASAIELAAHRAAARFPVDIYHPEYALVLKRFAEEIARIIKDHSESTKAS